MKELTCLEMETIIAGQWNNRTHLIIPNVSWGLGIHECDLLVVTRSGYCTEVEIKVSKADLKKDIAKKHGHSSKKIKTLYFAIPEYLMDCIDMIPERAGIYIVKEVIEYSGLPYRYAQLHRNAITNPDARKLTDIEYNKVSELGCMRIWSLKNNVLELKNQIEHLKSQLIPQK